MLAKVGIPLCKPDRRRRGHTKTASRGAADRPKNVMSRFYSFLIVPEGLLHFPPFPLPLHAPSPFSFFPCVLYHFWLSAAVLGTVFSI